MDCIFWRLSTFSENENTSHVFMNEIRMKDEPLQEPKENANVQTKGNMDLENNEKKMKYELKKLHSTKIILNI